ncbi:hypothetical protein [Chitinophaga japonensis]|uniref:Uncharacterized protein n=1 Tax=Chitinophaga japonensis TaxID=104662 RepID=A0A562SKV1_CHIJA|nr:hypothetical protein [Chitinophaga japonensis]TWI81947.1 hypothetical protein LX66_5261 [Chitinophaga japonensis]
MRNKYGYYALLLLLLAGMHLLLSGGWLAAAWCILGILLALRLRRERFLLLYVLGMETVIGAGYGFFTGYSGGQLDYLAQRSSIPVPAWIGISVAVNVITAVLCMAASYYGVLLLKRTQK